MTLITAPPSQPPDRADRFAGGILAVTAMLSLIVVMHHPVLQPVHGIAETAEAIHALAGIDRLVHGALMMLFGAQTVGFYYFSARLGFRSLAVLTGFLAYAMGAVVMMIPATLDGFVTPALADACLGASGCGAPQAVITLVAVSIQAFTKLALVAMSVAVLSWSIAVIARQSFTLRAAGFVGLICALAPLAALGMSAIRLRPDNLATIILAQVIWSIVAAILMMSEKISTI